MADAPQKPALVNALLTVGLVLAVLFAGVFVIAEQNHEHIDAAGRRVPAGENCQICIEIQIALRLIEAFCRLGASLFFAGFVLCLLSFVKSRQAFFPFNPIALKIKFNC